MKRNKGPHFSLAIRIFEFFAIILCVLLLIFSTLALATSKKGLSSVCEKYVRSVEINEVYLSNYEESGFSQELSRDFVKDDRMYNLVASVMADRLLAIFKDTQGYTLTQDECKNVVRGIIEEYNSEYSIGLTENKISSLTDYTCDISGITSMFIYDTPLAYRTSILDADNIDAEEFRLDTQILKGLAFLSRWYFLLAIGLMYVTILVIICFICNGNERSEIHTIIANTSLNPSLLCIGICLGELFCLPDEPIVTDYIFTNLLIVSVIGVVIGIIGYVTSKKILRKIEEKEFIKNANKNIGI